MDILTLSFILLNVAAYIYPYIVITGGSPISSFLNFQSLFSKSNSAINDGEFYRLVTANFLHADIVHLGVNMLSLFQVGPSVHAVYRGWGYALIFILSGVGGSVFSYLFNRMPSVGASGAIFGLIGALLAYAVITGSYGLISNIIFIIILNFGISLSPGSRIDNWGHLGGLITGFALGLVLTLGNRYIF